MVLKVVAWMHCDAGMRTCAHGCHGWHLMHDIENVGFRQFTNKVRRQHLLPCAACIDKADHDLHYRHPRSQVSPPPNIKRYSHVTCIHYSRAPEKVPHQQAVTTARWAPLVVRNNLYQILRKQGSLTVSCQCGMWSHYQGQMPVAQVSV